MHLPFRRSLLIVAYIAFIAIAPLIILYAVGYRPITTTTPQPVGVLIVNSFPRKATVSVNGTTYGSTPRSIPDLIPGIADVQVIKDGYQSWTKKLEIRPIQATDARAIKLLPTHPDQDIISADAATFSISPDTSTIAIATSSNEVFITDSNGKFKTNSISFTSTIESLLWSPDSTYIIATTARSEHSILHFSNQSLEKIPNSLPSDLQQMNWDTSHMHTLLGITNKHELFQYDVTQQTSIILNSSINNYVEANSQLIIQKTDNTVSKSDSTIDVKKRILSFISSSSGDLAMILDSGELQVLQKDNTILPIADHALSASWSPDGAMLVIQTSDNEIDIYNVNNNQIRTIPFHELHLLTRLSKPIQSPQWFPDNAHILYESDGNIICSEIDLRDHAVTNTINPAPELDSEIVSISKDGTYIIYINKTSSSMNLVRTWLVTKEDR
ncbi:MAG TPA: PEGA domain-containing protein [Candidatus Andersenbacteria bacterium]|nr:PEGA domain-containing protein [Candidatus Andersenbacteria bacterium]